MAFVRHRIQLLRFHVILKKYFTSVILFFFSYFQKFFIFCFLNFLLNN
jgi:hypothetical protein